jgi:hypothetical protein
LTDTQKIGLIVALASLYILFRIRLFRVRYRNARAKLEEGRALERERDGEP